MFEKKPFVGQKALIAGVANEMSLATPVARAFVEGGGELVMLSVKPDCAVKKGRAGEIAQELGAKIIAFDASKHESRRSVEKKLQRLGPFHHVFHAIAASDKNQLRGSFFDLTLDNFEMTNKISVFSFYWLAKVMYPLMPDGGTMTTLTFDASRPLPHYNMMGLAKSELETLARYLNFELGKLQIRVNAISASPEKTRAAAGIGDFRKIGHDAAGKSPMRRRAAKVSVAKMAIHLMLNPDVAGQTVYVDAGSSSVSMVTKENAGLVGRNYLMIAAEVAGVQIPDDAMAVIDKLAGELPSMD